MVGGVMVVVVLASDKCSGNLERILAVIFGRSLPALIPERSTERAGARRVDDAVRLTVSRPPRRHILRRSAASLGRPNTSGFARRVREPSTETVKDRAEQRPEPRDSRQAGGDDVGAGQGHR